MVKKVTMEKKNELRICDANLKYKKAFERTQNVRVIIPDIINIVQNSIKEIDIENGTGTRILEKIISKKKKI